MDDRNKIFNRVLQSARSSGEPIGPKYHMHDKQYQEWRKNNPEDSTDTTETEGVEAQLEELKIKPKLPAVKSIKPTALSQKTQTPKTTEVVDEEAEQKRLLEKYRKLQKQKLADTLKCEDRLSHIKSVGNGL